MIMVVVLVVAVVVAAAVAVAVVVNAELAKLLTTYQLTGGYKLIKESY